MSLRMGVWAPVWGTFLGRIEKPETVKEASFEHNARYIRRAEALGFESTLLLDRSLNSIKGVGAPVLEAWITAAALAPITEKIELIVAAKSAYRHPSLVARWGRTSTASAGGASPSTSSRAGGGRKTRWRASPSRRTMNATISRKKSCASSNPTGRRSASASRAGISRLPDGVTAPKPVRKPWPTFYFGGESTAAVKLAGRPRTFSCSTAVHSQKRGS